MNNFKTKFVALLVSCLLLSCLYGCGNQVVEFELDANIADIPDAALDVTDAALDNTPDVTDAAPDITPDVTDAALDSAPDVTDAALDITPDVIDAELDSTPDVADVIDAELDTTPDVADATLDSMPDVADAELDSMLDVTIDANPCSQNPVDLGLAANFAILAGSTVTSTGPTSITGDLGVSPGTAITGFPPGIIIGAQHAGDPTSAQGIADLTIAYNDAAGRTLCPISVAGNLGGMTLAPGLYKSTSSLAISSGDLTLDGQGDNNAIFIFQMASTLTTTPGRQVILTNGAKASNIFWQVGSSATFGTTSVFYGTIMADQAISFETGATLNGRALARIAAITLDSNTIVIPLP